jgi:GTP-binding protein YchF
VKLGIIGPTQSGKTTSFFALTGRAPEDAGMAGKHQAIVPVPDERLDVLLTMYPRDKRVPATVEFSDYGEIPRDSASYWSNVRLCDALVHIVPGFDPLSREDRGPESIAAAYNGFRADLSVADIDILERRAGKLKTQVKRPTKTRELDQKELALVEKLLEMAGSGESLASVELPENEDKFIRGFRLLTRKPELVLINLSENAWTEKPDLHGMFPEGAKTIEMCALLEHELAQLDESERGEFAEAYGITQPVGPRAISAAYETTGNIRFYTVGKEEVRAWTLETGSTAPEAAGKVHTDMARGFIRAKTIAYGDLKEAGSEKTAKEKGLVRLEGKDYTVQDGDVIEFHFSK